MATQTTPATWRSLAETDPEIAEAIRSELHRQNSGLELIASENFVSRAVLEDVQPHSGAQVNMVVYLTLLKPGDTVLGMNLAHGGHLTHGHPLNFSGKLYTIVPYGVRKDTERL